jgi:ribonuclease BN (tRNA processing enzyme)
VTQAPQLTFLGTGNAFSDGARANQALLLAGSDSRWLIDCGPTTVLQMRRFGESFAALDGILLTHLHADHALGVPMVLLTLNFLQPPQRPPLRIAGPPGTESYVRQAWELAYPDVARKGLAFALAYTELDGRRRERAELGELAVVSLPMSHSVPVNGYRVTLGGKTLAVSGDTGPAAPLDELGCGADLLVVECNSLRPLPRVAHLSAEEHRGRLPYGARQVALVHVGADVHAAADRLGEELGVLIPADGDRVAL